MSKQPDHSPPPSSSRNFKLLMYGALNETPTTRQRKLLAELISCPDYTGKLHYRKPQNLFLEGAMSDYYRCSLPASEEEGRESRIVVVKQRQQCGFHQVPRPACYEELLIWNAINGHENILPLLGYMNDSGDSSTCPALIAEWTPNGTVIEYLANYPDTDVVPICHGVAKGLAFMHEKGIIHKNVKQSNVMIGEDGRALLSGFTLSVWPALQAQISGLSMDTHKDSEDANLFAGPLSADVWAYGMTVMAIIQRLPALSDLTRKEHVVDIVLSRQPAPEAEGHPVYGGLWTVCQACWHPDAENHPTMAAIVRAFDEGDLGYLSSLAVASRLRRTLLGLRKADLSGKIVQLEAHNRSHGGFSDVYFGRSVVHGKYVAIKRVRYRLHDDLRFLKHMVRELQIWARLAHRNVLPLLGYTTDGGLFYLSLITEWMDNGTIMQYMKKERERPVKGITSGLAYLHTQNIVHSDMKSGNVLISPAGEPLVTDFGISHMLASSSLVSLASGTYGTMRWMAYEQINVDAEDGQAATRTPYTFQTDVWAFGMTVLELLTLDVPYAHLPMDQQVMITIYKKGLPPRPKAYSAGWSGAYKRLWAICKSCWDFDPKVRPSLDMIVNELDCIQRKSSVDHTSSASMED